MVVRSTSFVSVQGLGGVPDVPHAANVSLMTEGSGVGVLTEPPVDAKRYVDQNDLGQKAQPAADFVNINDLAQTHVAASLCFEITLTDCIRVTWETLLVDRKLFIEIPTGILPEGSKESFVTLLEYAEDELECSHVVVCFKKDRTDRASLVRTFMFLGFVAVAPGHPIVPMAGDLLFMAYTIE